MIGALAEVGLATSGEHGCYVQVGRSREVEAGPVPVPAILEMGIETVQPVAGDPSQNGAVLVENPATGEKIAEVGELPDRQGALAGPHSRAVNEISAFAPIMGKSLRFHFASFNGDCRLSR